MTIDCADRGHPRDVDVGLELRLVVKLQHALADIDGVVADALEVGGDLEPGGDKAQIAGGGLMQREQPDTQLVGLDVHAVDFGVARDNLARLAGVAIDQRIDRFGDLALDQPAHLEQAGAQAAQLLFILAVGVLRLDSCPSSPPRGANRSAR